MSANRSRRATYNQKGIFVDLREGAEPSEQPPSDQTCPALHVIAGLTPWADHQPRHAIGVDGRCKHCHTTIKGDSA
ncbi:hypothetical protein B3_41 [Propionibacterium phage B3]|uniref:Uncharacterized protein n=1 Tax=Propionibacterium phage B3 TaxID=1897533 RepID=A0A1D8ETE6_9CAUD|nr:hypothetical protein FDH09_gp41 [Propionibacterium phage B3]AOT24334.1 hypothetical protein B3_41 [Propionibacterium phage B3]